MMRIVTTKLGAYCLSVIIVSIMSAISLSGQDNSAHEQDIVNELRQIRQLLERQYETKSIYNQTDNKRNVILKLTDSEGMGSDTAEKVMVEFTDLQCPFCRKFHDGTLPALNKMYITTGKLRYYSRDMPLDIHPDAFMAAEAGRCAGAQGKFWQMRDWMITHPTELTQSDLVTYSKKLNISVDEFQTCLQTGRFKKAIETDISEGMRVGVHGTPAFVIGHRTSDGIEGEVIIGAISFEVLDRKLREMQ